jgi:hypothetical protein
VTSFRIFRVGSDRHAGHVASEKEARAVIARFAVESAFENVEDTNVSINGEFVIDAANDMFRYSFAKDFFSQRAYRTYLLQLFEEKLKVGDIVSVGNGFTLRYESFES